MPVPRSPYTWCPDCDGAGATPDANGVLTTCARCMGQGRLKIPGQPAVRALPPKPAAQPAASRAQAPAKPPAASAKSGPAKGASTKGGPAKSGSAKGASAKSAAGKAGPVAASEPRRPTPHEYFMGFAAHAATRSKDTTKVGAALVGPDGELRLTGYNGPPKGVKDTPDRFERPRKYLFSSHAEQNVIAFAARQGIRTADCTLYVTHHPCSSCARSIIQAGIVCVVVGGAGFGGEWSEEIAAARFMFTEAGVTLQED
ncbi:deoxycytidylate deaminase [Azorhizobium doebereinerae]|uniref:deoxycytidylate deaminase n=1 Tax=Azorhizobium doebereinerae TaxID=281091 RepID=UPI001FDA6509|nr:deaminase [Azorhizobium doebereinerae]